MTILFLLLLLLAGLLVWRLSIAERDADYWRSQSLFWQGQAHRAFKDNLAVEQECRRLYGESLRVVVGRKDVAWEIVRNVHDN